MGYKLQCTLCVTSVCRTRLKIRPQALPDLRAK